jgi:hypothetical protein
MKERERKKKSLQLKNKNKKEGKEKGKLVHVCTLCVGVVKQHLVLFLSTFSIAVVSQIQITL